MLNAELLFDKGKTRELYSEDFYHSKKPLSFSSFKDSLIQPEIPTDKKIFALGLYHNDVYVDTCLSLEYTVRGKTKEPYLKNICISDKKVIYIGPLIKCWGHFITDCLSKLWFFLDEKLNEEFGDYLIAYIPIEGFEMKGNYLRLFELLGIQSSRFLTIDKPTRFEEIIVPDCSYFLTESSDIRKFTNEYKLTIDKIKNAVNTNSSKQKRKIYFTNSSYAKTKKSFGLEKIDKYFKNHGFEIIHPEKLSLDDQITMLNNCELFASTDGSCGHNSVFLSDGAKAIIIPRGPDFTGYQECLCYVHNVEFSYIDSTLSVFTPFKKTHVGPMYYYVSEELLSFFGEKVANYKKYCRKNFYDLKKYILSSLTLNRTYNVMNYHSQKMFHYLSLMRKASFFQKMKSFFLNKRRKTSK